MVLVWGEFTPHDSGAASLQNEGPYSHLGTGREHQFNLATLAERQEMASSRRSETCKVLRPQAQHLIYFRGQVPADSLGHRTGHREYRLYPMERSTFSP